MPFLRVRSSVGRVADRLRGGQPRCRGDLRAAPDAPEPVPPPPLFQPALEPSRDCCDREREWVIMVIRLSRQLSRTCHGCLSRSEPIRDSRDSRDSSGMPQVSRLGDATGPTAAGDQPGLKQWGDWPWVGWLAGRPKRDPDPDTSTSVAMVANCQLVHYGAGAQSGHSQLSRLTSGDCSRLRAAHEPDWSSRAR